RSSSPHSNWGRRSASSGRSSRSISAARPLSWAGSSSRARAPSVSISPGRRSSSGPPPASWSTSSSRRSSEPSSRGTRPSVRPTRRPPDAVSFRRSRCRDHRDGGGPARGSRETHVVRVKSVLALVAVPAIVLAACTSGATPSPSASAPGASAPASAPAVSAPASAPASASTAAPATVRLQLQWNPQAQFGGYFAADQQGYFAAENLTVQMVPGGADVIPQAVGSQPDGPEFTIAWVPKVLQAREAGSDLVDIAPIFQRSGTLSVSWKDNAITEPCKFAGKKVGVWDFGNEFEVTAGALACGLTPGLENNGDPAKQFQKVIQPFDMTLLLSR